MKKPRTSRRSRAKPGSPPKGAYRLPTGGYVMKPTSMIVGSGRNARHMSIRAVRPDPPNLRMLAKVFLELARQQADDQRM